MLRMSLIWVTAAVLAVTAGRPQTGALWHTRLGGGAGQFVAPPPETGGFRPVALRRGRRIDDRPANRPAATTTTPRPSTQKKLVTLRPIGNNIQEILFNNNYRETPGEREPEPNNIDDYSQLTGLHPSEVWLLDDDLLVLKGGKLTDTIIDTTPIDNYRAPYRQPKFPPPGFQPDGLVAMGPASARHRQPEVRLPQFGYHSYGGGETLGRPPAPPRHHQGRAFPETPATGLIRNLDGLPKSFSISNSYPALGRLQPVGAPSTSAAFDAGGNYMTYTTHDNGFSYSYKTDGRAR